MFPKQKRIFISSKMSNRHGIDMIKIRNKISTALTEEGFEVWKHEDLPHSSLRLENSYLCPIRYCDIILFIIDVDDKMSEPILNEYIHAQEYDKEIIFIIRADKRPIKLHPAEFMSKDRHRKAENGKVLQETDEHYKQRLSFLNYIENHHTPLVQDYGNLVSACVNAVKIVIFDWNLHFRVPENFEERLPFIISPMQISAITKSLTGSISALPRNASFSSVVNKLMKTNPKTDTDFFAFLMNCCDEETFKAFRNSNTDEAKKMLTDDINRVCNDKNGETGKAIAEFIEILSNKSEAKHK